MKKVVVATVTRRPGGLAQTYDCLLNQVGQGTKFEVDWIVMDNVDRTLPDDLEINAERYSLPIKEGYERNVATSYNYALNIAQEREADLFISLQDYIWIPPDGVRRFLLLYDLYPTDIYSGLTSISVDPTVDDIVDINNPWTIFDTDKQIKPKQIAWHDPRTIHGTSYPVLNPMDWESNWSAVPKCVIDSDIRFDETYDVGAAYENQDFACSCDSQGHETRIDTLNHAISLPHKRYWPQEEIYDLDYLNIVRHHRKWNLDLPPDFDYDRLVDKVK